jgi:hypothetical protein
MGRVPQRRTCDVRGSGRPEYRFHGPGPANATAPFGCTSGRPLRAPPGKASAAFLSRLLCDGRGADAKFQLRYTQRMCGRAA